MQLDEAGLFPGSQREFRKDNFKRNVKNKYGLAKAFDTIRHDELWTIMAKVGYPPMFTVMVWQFHTDMQVRVQNDGG